MGRFNRQSPDHSRPQPRTATNGHTTPRQRANTSTARLAMAGQSTSRRSSGKAFYLVFLAALALGLYALAH